jgi:hypothetical protein
MHILIVAVDKAERFLPVAGNKKNKIYTRYFFFTK